MGGDHIDHDSQIAHEIKAEEIKRLLPFYSERIPHILRPFSHFWHQIPVVDTSAYEHLPLSNYSDKQIVDRTVFALQKLHTLNNKFFSPQEQRILNPLPNGIVSYGLNTTYQFMNGIYLVYLWKTWSYNVKSIGLLAFFVAAQQVTLQIPNLACEYLIQWPRRRRLAKQYIEVYGPEYFHKIIDPRFSVHSLETLNNIA